MRPSLSALWLLAAVLCAIAASGGPGGAAAAYPQVRAGKGRGRSRMTRGFKNVALSTARGFGKRAGGGDPAAPAAGAGAGAAPPPPPALEMLAEQLAERGPAADSFPVEWFVEELQSNPELARLIVRKFVDANQDGELGPDELLRPLY